MKKNILLSIGILAIISFSCKKDRDCVCQANGIEYIAELGKSKKEDAEAACGATELSLQLQEDENASCEVVDK